MITSNSFVMTPSAQLSLVSSNVVGVDRNAGIVYKRMKVYLGAATYRTGGHLHFFDYIVNHMGQDIIQENISDVFTW